jgi:hypothetical protein
VGWKNLVLVKVGWPVWLSRQHLNDIVAQPDTPQEVLTYILAYRRVNPGLAQKIIDHPKAPKGALALAKSKYPDYDFTAEQQSWIWDEPGFVVNGVTLKRLEKELVRVDLNQVLSGVLSWLGGLAADGLGSGVSSFPPQEQISLVVGGALARNPTCPRWLFYQLLEDVRQHRWLAGNPAVTEEMLDLIVGGVGQAVDATILLKVGVNPQVSLATLAALALRDDEVVRQNAGLRLAERAEGHSLNWEVEAATVGL